MLKTIEDLENNGNKLNYIEYMNSFGAVMTDGILLHKYNARVPINVDRVKRCSLHKIRKLHWNFFLFLMALLIVVIAFSISFEEIKIWLFVLSGSIVISIPFLKIYKYHFIILKEGDFIKIELDEYLKEDAKKIASIVNKKIKNKR